MASTFSHAQEGTATTVKTTFNRTTSISGVIKASKTVIWKQLTEENMASWTSTIISVEGEMKEGNKIRLQSSLDSNRVFKLKVKEFIPNTKLIWGDNKGERTFWLEEINANTTRFSMEEKIGGLMFPLYAKYIPSFDESFERFFSDLKKAVE